jgi:CrcB protein
MEKILFIGIGGFLGANLRFFISNWAMEKWGPAFPFGTFVINITGSFIIGLFVTLATEKFVLEPELRLMIITGFLGAYTTFSTFALESAELILNGSRNLGLVNLLGSCFIGLIACFAGIMLGKSL